MTPDELPALPPPDSVWQALCEGLWAVDSIRSHRHEIQQDPGWLAPHFAEYLCQIEQADRFGASLQGKLEISAANDLRLESGPVEHGGRAGESYTEIAQMIVAQVVSALIVAAHWRQNGDWKPLDVAEFPKLEAITAAVRNLRLSFHFELLTAAIAQEQKRVLIRNSPGADSADKKPDREKKSVAVPRNRNVLKLSRFLREKRLPGETERDAAIRFARGDEKKADNLLRQRRRFHELRS